MNTFTVAKILPKEITFNFDTVLDQIKDCIIFEQVTLDSMMDLIVETINLDSKLMGDTIMCYEDDSYVYQLCHLNMEDNGGKNEITELNSVGSALSLGSTAIFGKCVFICSEITSNGTCKPYSVTMDMIVDIIHRKMIHT